MKIDSNQVMRESPIVTESRKSNPMTPQIQQSPTKSTSLATTPTWYTTQAVLLQSLGFIYFVAFLSAYYQNEGLMGEHGLMPAKEYWDAIRQKHSSSSALTWWQQFQQYPCIFWWTELNDWSMRSLTLVGLTMSALVTLNRQFHVMLQFFLLWLLYFSIVTVSGHTSFYSYGWESQLLETGFLAIFLCPNAMELQWVATTPSTPPRPPFPLILWLFRWLSFRISIGAGLIKIRGDSCWTQKTCLFYHFETQPIPSPTSFFFHFLPSPILKHAVDLDLFVQVYTSWMVLLPTYIPKCPKLSQGCLQIVRWGGWIQVAFMVNIILSGNLGFLPHLTIVPALACYDDACWPNWLAPYAHHPPIPNFEEEEERRNNRHSMALLTWVKPRLLVNYAYALLVLYLSQPVVINLLQLGGGRQQMNASFDPFRLVNTYGAFGSVGKQRYEPIVSITYDPLDGVGADRSNDTAVEWIELEFPCKPGNLYRRPCFCAPYHCECDLSRLLKVSLFRKQV